MPAEVVNQDSAAAGLGGSRLLWVGRHSVSSGRVSRTRVRSAVIIGLLFLFKTVVDSGGNFDLAHLFPSDPRTNVGSPALEAL